MEPVAPLEPEGPVGPVGPVGPIQQQLDEQHEHEELSGEQSMIFMLQKSSLLVLSSSLL